jgi:hypothetical protein
VFTLVSIAAVLAGSGALLAQSRPAAALMPFDEVRPGMRGYGLTVFRGMRPERFEVEVIDVVHNFRPRMNAILIRPTHPVLEHAGTVAGMSGSPIYLEGRLAGAYAYGWEFGRDPVAGVTPIESMLAELRRPRRTPPGLLPGSQVPFEILQGGARAETSPSPWDTLVRRAEAQRTPLATAYGALVPVATPLTVGGMGNRALRRLTEALEPFGILPVQAGGSGSNTPPPDAPTRYENGGAVAVRLLQGDISGNATGTVTYVDGDQLVGFGHPMMGMGETAMPAAISRIMWILASERRSMKISEPVRNLGALVQDRPTTIVVDERASAPTVPVHVVIRGVDGAPHGEWNVRVAGHRMFAPRLAASVLETALEETAGDTGDVAWTVRTRITLRNRAPVEFVEHGANGTGVQLGMMAAHDFLARVSDNAFGPTPIDAVDYAVDLRWARDFSYIRHVTLAQSEADPGSTVELRIQLARYGEAPETRTVRLPVPRALAGREMEIEIASGADTAPDVPEPESLDDLLRNLTTRYPDDALVVTVRLPGTGATLRGRVLRNLPASAFDALRPGVSTDGADPLWNVQRTIVPVGRIILGRDRVRLRVREVRQ